MNLVGRIVAIAESLDRSQIEWALGGALALAYATEEPRATRDVDVNVFVPSSEVDRVFAAMPEGVAHGPADRRAVLATDQVRLWWDDTPINLFLAADAFHLDAATRCAEVEFSGRRVRVLCPEDLAVFKAMFDRPKDWVDIAEMAASRALDRAIAAERLQALIGNDSRVTRLAEGD
jgi:hypothetical protein